MEKVLPFNLGHPILCLRSSNFRTRRGPELFEVGNRLRVIFLGNNPLHRVGILRKKRTKRGFIVLLKEKKVAKNCEEAQAFIDSILGAQVSFKKGAYFIIKKVAVKDEYYLTEFREITF
ncbi:MAG: hypothetical protein HYV45_01015 [Candidatus Moranbacteria bacterium]|nr:hypothetical protein [Candidatus Moranbacteria bacterium]